MIMPFAGLWMLGRTLAGTTDTRAFGAAVPLRYHSRRGGSIAGEKVVSSALTPGGGAGSTDKAYETTP